VCAVPDMATDRERSSLSEWSKVMKDFHLNDVSIDRYKAEMKHVLVSAGKDIFQEMTDEVEFDWDAIEPMRTEKVKFKRPKQSGIGYQIVERDWDEALDGEDFLKRHKAWSYRKEKYTAVKERLWPFIMSTLTEDMKSDVVAEATFNDLQRAGDTLGLYKLLSKAVQVTVQVTSYRKAENRYDMICNFSSCFLAYVPVYA
jgi:hypothetical protein